MFVCMKASDLNKLLIGFLTGDKLHQSIQEEVSSYRELIEKIGSVNPLIYYEDAEITLDRYKIEKLLMTTLSGKLTNVDLAYICDCLTLAEKVHFSDNITEDIVFAIADPEINGGFKSDSELRYLLQKCQSYR